MPIPGQCPECDCVQFNTSILPPDEHEYEGWVTYVECGACEFEAYAPELE